MRDEKLRSKALERAQGYLKLPMPRLTVQSHDYKRHEPTTLFAGLKSHRKDHRDA